MGNGRHGVSEEEKKTKHDIPRILDAYSALGVLRRGRLGIIFIGRLYTTVYYYWLVNHMRSVSEV